VIERHQCPVSAATGFEMEWLPVTAGTFEGTQVTRTQTAASISFHLGRPYP